MVLLAFAGMMFALAFVVWLVGGGPGATDLGQWMIDRGL
jgi:hypothetical protein